VLGRFNEKVTASEVIGTLTNAARTKLFVSLPLAYELKSELKLGAGTANDAIEVVSSPSDAQYLLVGSLRGELAAYAWLLPNAGSQDAASQPMPVRSDWFATGEITTSPLKPAARKLEESALGIGQIKSWLTLESPADDGSFAYKLVLSNATTRALVTGDTLLQEEKSAISDEKQLRAALPVFKAGNRFSVLLHASPESLKRGSEQRHIYVFSLDAFGKRQLLYPAEGQGASQRLPARPVGNNNYPTMIPLASGFGVGKPYGIDTYFLLTSRTAISDTSVLESAGVRTRGGSDHPLELLLKSVGSATRGTAVPVPADWSIQRITIRSVEK
jgi:hypothetical protein